MLMTVDLNPKQAARVLEQAARSHAALQLEPRNRADGMVIAATLVRIEGNLMCVALEKDCGLTPVDLIGAFCEAQLPLEGQMYSFTTCVLDVPDGDPPSRVMVSAPEVVQVANRRRFERTNATVASQVRIYVPGVDAPCVGLLTCVSAGGLSCVLPGASAGDALLVGDEVRAQFELAGVTGTFDLRVVICTKRAGPDELHLGLEFATRGYSPAEVKTLEAFRATLAEVFADHLDANGEA
ncbi:MAG: PilZ domain-containing protein [Phycisphaerae bacterium]|jgi:hypothetical protein